MPRSPTPSSVGRGGATTSSPSIHRIHASSPTFLDGPQCPSSASSSPRPRQWPVGLEMAGAGHGKGEPLFFMHFTIVHYLFLLRHHLSTTLDAQGSLVELTIGFHGRPSSKMAGDGQEGRGRCPSLPFSRFLALSSSSFFPPALHEPCLSFEGSRPSPWLPDL